MAEYSNKSMRLLRDTHPQIQEVFMEVIKYFDNTVITGRRSKIGQDKMVREGKSQVAYPNSKHNSYPSRAVDIAPYPINWKDRERFNLFAGFVLGIAKSKGINLRWGGDWNMNSQVSDNSFDDLLHFELLD